MTLSWLKVRLEVRAEKAGHGELSWEWEGEGEGDEAGGGTEATRRPRATVHWLTDAGWHGIGMS